MLERRAWDVDALLKPHNEHLSLVPVLIYKAIFSTAGDRLLRAVPRRRRGRAPDRARAAVRLRAAAGRRRARARRRRRDRGASGRRGRTCCGRSRWASSARWRRASARCSCLDRGDRRGRDRGVGAAHRRARVVVAGHPDLRRRGARDPRAAGPRARAGGSSSPRPCSTASGTSPTAAVARRASTTCSPRPPTSPRRRRRRSARCSGSASSGGGRWCSRSARCSCWRSGAAWPTRGGSRR